MLKDKILASQKEINTMLERYKNKYRTQSARLKNWDYGSDALYYVTICTQNREHYFGDIANDEMQLSQLGMVAEKYWSEIPNHFPFVILDACVVMPNHIHGIIVIDKNDDRNIVETPESGVSTPKPNATPSPNRQRILNASKKWKPATLGVIINQYKRAVTIHARQIHSGFAWQSRFYDHIIRNEKSYNNIVNYIITNPQHWDIDENRK